MRDLRTTVTNRVVRRGRWSAAGRFRGVIAPMLAKSGWFQAAAKDYRKPKQTFALVNSAARRKAGDVAFTFSPTIRLTCLSQHADRSFFDIDSRRIFQTLNVRNSQHIDRSVSDTATTKNFQTINVKYSPFSFAERTKVRELLESLFSTFRLTAHELMRSDTHGRNAPAKAQKRKESSKFFLGAFAPLREKTLQLTRVSESKLFTNRLASSNTSNHQQRQDNWLLLRSNEAKTTDEPRAAMNTFTTLTLNFAAPKASETELVQQRIAHFVSLPALTYANRQKEMSDNIVQALRELRTVEPEPKHVAVPVLPTIEQLTSQVKTQLERELRIERERRGL